MRIVWFGGVPSLEKVTCIAYSFFQFQQRPISARKKKEMKKERKRKAEERHRQKFGHSRLRVPSDDEESVITVIAKETAVMKI